MELWVRAPSGMPAFHIREPRIASHFCLCCSVSFLLKHLLQSTAQVRRFCHGSLDEVTGSQIWLGPDPIVVVFSGVVSGNLALPASLHSFFKNVSELNNFF